MTTKPKLITYTPALCNHLDNLKLSWQAQKEIAINRIEECATDQDEDGCKIAQVDLSVATLALAKVMEHLAKANEEWTR